MSSTVEIERVNRSGEEPLLNEDVLLITRGNFGGTAETAFRPMCLDEGLFIVSLVRYHQINNFAISVSKNLI